MKNEGHDEWIALKAERRAQAAGRRAQAGRDFKDAKALAQEHGMRLMRHTEAHYKLAIPRPLSPSWILEIYPGNQRLYRSRAAVPPWLDLPEYGPWTLVDVINAAAAEMDAIVLR